MGGGKFHRVAVSGGCGFGDIYSIAEVVVGSVSNIPAINTVGGFSCKITLVPNGAMEDRLKSKAPLRWAAVES